MQIYNSNDNIKTLGIAENKQNLIKNYSDKRSGKSTMEASLVASKNNQKEEKQANMEF